MNCVKDDFALLMATKRLIAYYENYIMANFPKEKKHIKARCNDALNSLHENILRANVNEGSIRGKYQKECLVYVSILDFNFHLIYELKIITHRRYKSLLTLLSNIKNLLYGWINAEKKSNV